MKRVIKNILLVAVPVCIAFAALMIGRMNFGIKDVLNALIGNGEETDSIIRMTVLSLRLPRVLLSLVVGAGLSVAGLTFQALFANPLATPDTLGVASGASFGAAVGILLSLPLLGIGLSAFFFGLVAVIVTTVAGYGKGRGMTGIVLSGIMVGSLFSALVSAVKFMADSESELPAITFFLMGSMQSASYRTIICFAPVIVIGIVVIFALRWRINLLPLSEEEIKSAGVNARALRITAVLSATLITSASIAMCGQVGWIGLLVPHAARMIVGNNYKDVVPVSISIGAGFMVIVDTLARSMTAAELPISILTAIIGAPFFIFLMRKQGGRM